MTHHPGSPQVGRPISESEAMPEFRADAARKSPEKPAARVQADIAPKPEPSSQGGAATAVVVEEKPAASPSGGLRRVLMAGAGLAVLAAGAYYGWDYWTVGRFHVATDDAYVQADNT